VWSERAIEKTLRKRLSDEFGEGEGETVFSRYVQARSKLVQDVLPFIPAEEPGLTDHGERHLANVLDNVERLLGDEISDLNVWELYLLCTCVLFHDVGNVYGRHDHNRRITDVYNNVWEEGDQDRLERSLVTSIAGAHCGEATDGSYDTLNNVAIEAQYKGNLVQAQVLSALLRFADELAEGPQRTSYFMQQQGLYPAESEIYHKYANVTNLAIDKPNGRILLDYQIEISLSDGSLLAEDDVPLGEFMNFIYYRINKLNTERRYTKYYCKYLTNISINRASVNFLHNSILLPIDLQPIELSDLVLPASDSIDIPSEYEDYVFDKLERKILGLLIPREEDEGL